MVSSVRFCKTNGLSNLCCQRLVIGAIVTAIVLAILAAIAISQFRLVGAAYYSTCVFGGLSMSAVIILCIHYFSSPQPKKSVGLEKNNTT